MFNIDTIFILPKDEATAFGMLFFQFTYIKITILGKIWVQWKQICIFEYIYYVLECRRSLCKSPITHKSRKNRNMKPRQMYTVCRGSLSKTKADFLANAMDSKLYWLQCLFRIRELYSSWQDSCYKSLNGMWLCKNDQIQFSSNFCLFWSLIDGTAW